MNEEILRALGLSPGATAEQIAAAVAQLNTKTLELEAKAKAEAQARLEAEARERIAEEKRKAEALEAEEAKALADHERDVATFMVDITDGPKATFEKMCFVVTDGKRRPNPDGFAAAKVLADTLVGARKSSLAGPSAQVHAAKQTLTTTAPAGATPQATGPVMYTFKGSTTPINLTRLAGVTPEMIAARQASMQARAAARGQRIDD